MVTYHYYPYFMDEDIVLAHSPIAGNDQRWDLNSQSLNPEPMATTLRDVTSPEEMWRGSFPLKESSQVALSGDMSVGWGKHQ